MLLLRTGMDELLPLAAAAASTGPVLGPGSPNCAVRAVLAPKRAQSSLAAGVSDCCCCCCCC